MIDYEVKWIREKSIADLGLFGKPDKIAYISKIEADKSRDFKIAKAEGAIEVSLVQDKKGHSVSKLKNEPLPPHSEIKESIERGFALLVEQNAHHWKTLFSMMKNIQLTPPTKTSLVPEAYRGEKFVEKIPENISFLETPKSSTLTEESGGKNVSSSVDALRKMRASKRTSENNP
jgi:hypothetical protein